MIWKRHTRAAGLCILGLLALDMLDARTWQVTWRASADLELGPATSRERVDATLREVVRRILRPIPSMAAGASAGAAR